MVTLEAWLVVIAAAEPAWSRLRAPRAPERCSDVSEIDSYADDLPISSSGTIT